MKKLILPKMFLLFLISMIATPGAFAYERDQLNRIENALDRIEKRLDRIEELVTQDGRGRRESSWTCSAICGTFDRSNKLQTEGEVESYDARTAGQAFEKIKAMCNEDLKFNNYTPKLFLRRTIDGDDSRQVIEFANLQNSCFKN